MICKYKIDIKWPRTLGGCFLPCKTFGIFLLRGPSGLCMFTWWTRPGGFCMLTWRTGLEKNEILLIKDLMAKDQVGLFCTLQTSWCISFERTIWPLYVHLVNWTGWILHVHLVEPLTLKPLYFKKLPHWSTLKILDFS